MNGSFGPIRIRITATRWTMIDAMTPSRAVSGLAIVGVSGR
jgi:hypothetical protein